MDNLPHCTSDSSGGKQQPLLTVEDSSRQYVPAPTEEIRKTGSILDLMNASYKSIGTPIMDNALSNSAITNTLHLLPSSSNKRGPTPQILTQEPPMKRQRNVTIDIPKRRNVHVAQKQQYQQQQQHLIQWNTKGISERNPYMETVPYPNQQHALLNQHTSPISPQICADDIFRYNVARSSQVNPIPDSPVTSEQISENPVRAGIIPPPPSHFSYQFNQFANQMLSRFNQMLQLQSTYLQKVTESLDQALYRISKLENQVDSLLNERKSCQQLQQKESSEVYDNYRVNDPAFESRIENKI
jgi:hypothetical protein